MDIATKKMNKPERTKVPLLAASFLGGLYCLLNAAGADLFCDTQGCEIYASYGLFGISFYVYGFGVFFGIFLLTLFSRAPYARPLLALTLGLALLFDTLFLLYQTLLWPCSSCQVVALLIGLSALAGGIAFNLPGRKLLIAIGIIWSLFFIIVGIAVVKEVAFKPWPIYGSSQAPVKIYFSPTCPACEEAVRKMLDNAQMAGQTGLYPIAKNREDEARLAEMLESATPEVNAKAVLGLFAPAPQQGPTLSIRNRLRLLSNKMALARYGVTKVPLILSPNIIEADDSGSSDRQPWSIEKLWENPAGNTPATGCSMIGNDEDCE